MPPWDHHRREEGEEGAVEEEAVAAAGVAEARPRVARLLRRLMTPRNPQAQALWHLQAGSPV